MTIGMWFVNDIANLLAAIRKQQESIMAYVSQTPEARAYAAGCADTLAALALAFGIEPADD
jgi:acyl-coenzyme A synthetase/AMP-(fatty) acid ligase